MAYEEETPSPKQRGSAKENERRRSQPMSKPNSNNKERENQSDMSDVDMKNLLGYLNQSEWIYSLNIGNIM